MPENDYSILFNECTDLELVVLQKEAQDIGDTEFRNAILIELGRREKAHNDQPPTPPNNTIRTS